MNFPFAETSVGTGDLWMPIQQSTIAAEVDWAFYFVLWISVILFVPIVAIMLYFVVRYRRRPGVPPEPSPSHHQGLELAWTIPTIPIVGVIFFVGVNGFIDMRTMPANAMEVNVVAAKWNWQFIYDNGAISDKLHVPVDRNIVLIMRSNDVLHAMYLPTCRVKQDIVPGRYTKLWFRATKPGEANLFCAEYCGDGHSAMLSKLVVHESGGYEQWVADALDWRKSRMTPLEAGKMLYETRGCKGCHSIDGSSNKGPTFKGSYGTERDYTSPAGPGRVKMDENYIRESILEPLAKVRVGFDPVMPSFKGLLKDYDIDAIIEYLKSVK